MSAENATSERINKAGLEEGTSIPGLPQDDAEKLLNAQEWQIVRDLFAGLREPPDPREYRGSYDDPTSLSGISAERAKRTLEDSGDALKRFREKYPEHTRRRTGHKKK